MVGAKATKLPVMSCLRQVGAMAVLGTAQQFKELSLELGMDATAQSQANWDFCERAPIIIFALKPVFKALQTQFFTYVLGLIIIRCNFVTTNNAMNGIYFLLFASAASFAALGPSPHCELLKKLAQS